MNVDEFTLGATSSLRRSIFEINTFLAGNEVEQVSGLRGEYHETLMLYGIHWYRQGFRRGHRESFSRFSDGNAVPRLIRVDTHKTFLGLSRDVIVLRSKITT